jgi:flagellar motor switch protein FliM
MIEPVRDMLSSPLQGEALEIDRRWVRLLSQQVQTAFIDLKVELAEVGSNFHQILNMQVGDVLPLTMPEHVTAKVDGVPVMECNYGTFNGQYALRVHKMISAQDHSKENVYE